LEASNSTEGSDATKYMLLIYQGTSPTPRSPDSWARLSEDERKAVFAAYQEVNKTPGVTPGVVPQPADKTATTVRVEDGETQAVDGPFVPSEQALDGYLMFESDGSSRRDRARVARSGGPHGRCRRGAAGGGSVLTVDRPGRSNERTERRRR
jgi:hypothetical protein